MIRPPTLQALSRQYAVCFRKAYASRRSLHAESTESHLPGPVDWNQIHLDMLFDRRRSSIIYPSHCTPSSKPTEKPTELIIAPDIIENKALKKESHLFDTYEQVTQLQTSGGFSRGQAKVVMETLQNLLRISVAKRTDQLLTMPQLENESYLISAAVAEFHREVQLFRRNDSALLQSELNTLAREVESLEQRLSEDLGTMRDELELTMNDYRSDIREEQTITHHQIQGINNRLTVSLGDTATELESLKWNVIWRGLLGGLVTALGIAAVGSGLSVIRNTRVAAVERKEAIRLAGENLTYADMELS